MSNHKWERKYPLSDNRWNLKSEHGRRGGNRISDILVNITIIDCNLPSEIVRPINNLKRMW